MADGFTIERASMRHLDAIEEIEQASFPEPWRREFFRSEIAAEGRFNLIARRDRTVVGFMFSMWIFDELHVNKIAVTASERRQGIAETLMDRCFEFARERDVRSIFLEVRQSNLGAQAFYRRLGFTSSYIRPRYYPDGEAAVVMMLTLRASGEPPG
jgi:[ribosomal protein S18]-alanine N-acetyltransferase